MGRWGDGMGRCSHLLPMSMVTARQWWTCFSAVRRFAGGKLTSLVQWSLVGIFALPRRTDGLLFTLLLVNISPQCPKMGSSDVASHSQNNLFESTTLLPHYDTLSRPHRAEQRPHRDQNAGQGGFPGESENAKADFCCVRVDC